MNYATQQNIGNNPYTRTAKATEVAPTVGRVRTMDAKTKRRRPSTERQTEIRTDSNATNGFLKCTFLPKLKTAQSVQACKKSERDFYQSLSKLANITALSQCQPDRITAIHTIWYWLCGIWIPK